MMKLHVRSRISISSIVLALAVLASACSSARDSGRSRPAAETSPSCSAICTETTGDCRITGVRSVPPGVAVDCPGRTIHVTGKGRLQVTDGFMILRAGDLIIDEGGEIRARAEAARMGTGIMIQLTGDLDTGGTITASGPSGGGHVEIGAPGGIRLRAGGGGIQAMGSVPGTDAGTITLSTDGDAIIEAPLLAATLLGPDAADGGRIEIAAGGDVTIGSRFSVSGTRSSAGTIRIDADGAVTIDAAMDATGEGNDADGGEIAITGTNLLLRAPLQAQGGIGATAEEAIGGTILLYAITPGGEASPGPGIVAIDIGADVDASSAKGPGGFHGGAIAADSDGDLTLRDGVVMTTDAGGEASAAGDITLTAAGTLSIGTGAKVTGACPPVADGRGAIIDLSACRLTLGNGASIDANGPLGGRITLTGDQALALPPSVRLRAVGANDRRQGSITLLSGIDLPLREDDARFQPPPEVDKDEDLDICP